MISLGQSNLRTTYIKGLGGFLRKPGYNWRSRRKVIYVMGLPTKLYFDKHIRKDSSLEEYSKKTLKDK